MQCLTGKINLTPTQVPHIPCQHKHVCDWSWYVMWKWQRSQTNTNSPLLWKSTSGFSTKSSPLPLSLWTYLWLLLTNPVTSEASCVTLTHRAEEMFLLCLCHLKTAVLSVFLQQKGCCAPESSIPPLHALKNMSEGYVKCHKRPSIVQI